MTAVPAILRTQFVAGVGIVCFYNVQGVVWRVFTAHIVGCFYGVLIADAHNAEPTAHLMFGARRSCQAAQSN